jgi:Zn-dependent protease
VTRESVLAVAIPRPRSAERAGIPVQLDVSCFAALALGAWTLADTILPLAAPERSAAAYWAAAVAAAVTLLACVGVHEAAHCLVARRAGFGVRGVTLSFFGGATELDGRPASPAVELRIALAGPLANLGIALAAAAAHVALVELGADPLASAAAAIVMVANVGLAALNVLPGLPLDGGHALNAVLTRLGSRPRRATRTTALVGRALGASLLALAVLAAASGDTSLGLWAALLGLVLSRDADRV